jgi:hypothetical protein
MRLAGLDIEPHPDRRGLTQMSTTAATADKGLDGFRATTTSRRADELARTFFDAVNAGDLARADAVLARSFLSYDVHGTRSRTGLRRYHSDLRRPFPDLRFERCRSRDRCPPGACTEIQGRYP